jgi:hypothetical protein
MAYLRHSHSSGVGCQLTPAPPVVVAVVVVIIVADNIAELLIFIIM